MDLDDLQGEASALRAALGADRVAFWRTDRDGTAQPRGSDPVDWLTAGFLPRPGGAGVLRSNGAAARELLPALLRVGLKSQAAVLSLRCGATAGAFAVWDDPERVPPQASAIAEFARRALQRQLEAPGPRALADAQRRLAVVLDALPQGVVLVPEPGGNGYANLAAARMLGITPGHVGAEVIAAGLQALAARARNPHEIRAQIAPVLRHEHVPVRPHTWLLDGEPAALRVTYAPLGPVDGEGWVWLFDDVSSAERVSAQQRPHLSALEAAANAMMITDAAGTIDWVNPAFCRMTGYRIDEVIGSRPQDLLRSKNQPREIFATVRDTIYRGKVWDGEMINRRKDGSDYVEWQTITPVLEDGVIRHFVSVKQDITERKRLYRELEERMRELEAAKRAADRANAAKSQFLANMSHEIRTPLNGIMGMGQLLAMEPLNREQQELVQGLAESSTLLLRVVNDILDFSKIDAGQLRIERQPFLLPVLLDRLELPLRSMAEPKGLKLSVSYDGSAPQRLLGDTLRLDQVLLNLAGNAIKFTDAGSVEIAVTAGARPAAPGAIALRFEIRDTGIGIDADTLGRLFTPFTQADSSNTRRHGGTGLGLAISRRLIEQMGGAIEVDSRPGHGSTFRFELVFDLAGSEARAPSRAPPARPGGKQLFAGRRIVVADDNTMNRFVLESILRSGGATVVPVDDGQAAIAALLADPGSVDLVLMDIQMPVLDGLAAIRAIRADPRLAHLPIIAVTAGVFAADREAAMAAGADAFVGKPVDVLQLTSVAVPLLREPRIPAAAKISPRSPGRVRESAPG